MATMGAPQTFAAAETAQIRLAAMINAELALTLADNASLRQYITYVGDTNGSGSDTVRWRRVSLGASTPLSNIGDGVALTSSDMDAFTSDVTVSRSGLCFDITDLLSFTKLGYDLDPYFVANTMAAAAEARANEIICGTFSGITANKGSLTTALSMSDWLDAMYTLEEANNGNDLVCIVKNKQFSDIQKALRSENNNFLAFSQQSEDMSSSKPQGYAGSLLGVDIFRSEYVQEDATTAGWEGAMFSRGGIGYATGSPSIVGSVSVFRPGGSPVVVEFDREGKSGITSIIGHMYMGAAVLEQARACRLVSIK